MSQGASPEALPERRIETSGWSLRSVQHVRRIEPSLSRLSYSHPMSRPGQSPVPLTICTYSYASFSIAREESRNNYDGTISQADSKDDSSRMALRLSNIGPAETIRYRKDLRRGGNPDKPEFTRWSQRRLWSICRRARTAFASLTAGRLTVFVKDSEKK